MRAESSYRWPRLAPRCWIIASCGCIRSQGLDCSSSKAVRDLSSERRETVRFLSLSAWDGSANGSEYERTRLPQTSEASAVEGTQSAQVCTTGERKNPNKRGNEIASENLVQMRGVKQRVRGWQEGHRQLKASPLSNGRSE